MVGKDQLKSGNIIVGKYVINKLNLGNGIVLSLGDDKQKILSLIDKPSRIHRNISNEIPQIIYNADIVACYYYDEFKVILVIDIWGLLNSIIIRNPNISYMGFKIGDCIKLDKPYINLMRLQDNLAQIEEIIIQSPKIIPNNISKRKKSEYENTLENWCRVIMTNYPS